MFGTKESTAAPPLVTTFTICSSDFVFLTPEEAVFLLSVAGAVRFGAGLAGLGFLAGDLAGVLPFALLLEGGGGGGAFLA